MPTKLCFNLSTLARALSPNFWALLTAALMLVPASPLRAAVDYQITDSFAAVANPNGPWSYGWKPNVLGPFTTVQVTHSSPVNPGQVPSWQLTGSTSPSFYKNVSAVPVSAGGLASFEPGEVWFYSGETGAPQAYGVIRFTVPTGISGSFRLAVAVSPVYLITGLQGDTDFHVVRNGTELFAQSLPAGASVGFTNTLSLSTGDTVDFVLGRGADNNGYGSGMRIAGSLLLEGDIAPPVCTQTPTGLVGWWPLDGSAADLKHGNDGQLFGAPGFVAGEVGQGLRFDGANDSVRIQATALTDVGAGLGFTVESWIKPEELNSSSALVEWSTAVGPQPGFHIFTSVQGAGNLFANLMDTAGHSHHLFTPAGTLTLATFQHVAFTYDRSSGIARFYRNGVVVLEANVGDLRLDTTGDIFLGYRLLGGTPYYFRGTMDEVSLYNRALTGAEIQAIHDSSTAGKCPPATPPTIKQAPVDQVIWETQTGHFSVNAIGTAPLSYQWELDEFELENQTGATLNITNAQPNQSGSYRVVISNVYGAVTSAPVTLTVKPLTVPEILTQPADLTVTETLPASFSVVPANNQPAAYQWYFLDAPLEGETSQTLLIAHAAPTNAGAYYVIITNVMGSVTSSVAHLTVEPITCLTPAPGLAAWWPMEGGLEDSVSGVSGSLSNGPAFTPGKVGFGLQLDGVNDFAFSPPTPDSDIGASAAGFTVEMWINPAQVSSPSAVLEWSITTGVQPGLHIFTAVGGAGSLFANIMETNGTSHNFFGPGGVLVAGVFQHIALTYDRPSGIARFYLNGNQVAQTAIGNVRVDTRPGMWFGRRFQGPSAYWFQGRIDEVTLYAVPLSASQLQSIVLAGAEGKCSPASTPTITQQPVASSVLASQTATFSVVARGGRPLSYQWLFNGSAITDATNSTLTVESVQAPNAGDYSVVVSNSEGSTTSNPATLSVVPSRTLRLGSIAPQQEGSAIELPIELVSDGDVGGMTFILNYESVYLRGAVINWSPLLADSFSDANYTVAGQVRVTFALPATALPAGTQVVATVSFLTRSVPNNLTSPLTLAVSDASGPLGDALTIGNLTQGTTLSITKRLYTGDNNANGRLDVGDASAILRYVAQPDTVRAWDVLGNDLNASGGLDSGDAIRVLRAAAGIDPQPGVPPASFVAASVFTAAGSAAGTRPGAVVLSPSSSHALPGETLTLELRLQDVQIPISGASFTVDYPTNALRLVNAQSYHTGVIVPANAISVWNVSPAQNNFTTQNGHITLASSSANPWPASNGVLATISFLVQPGASSVYASLMVLRDTELSADGFSNQLLPSSSAVLYGRAPVPGSLSGASKLPNGGFRFTIDGDPNADYTIEWSSDLKHWSYLTNLVNKTGALPFTDPAGVVDPWRFYRVRPTAP